MASAPTRSSGCADSTQFLPALGAESGDDAFLAAQFQHYLDAYVAAWSPFADVPAALDELELPASASPSSRTVSPRQQRLKLERTGLVGHFDRILTPTEVGAPKPDATAFVNACTMLAVDPATTAYVGDNLEVDAVGASAAGLRGIWLDRPESDATSPPAVTRITSLSALAASLRSDWPLRPPVTAAQLLAPHEPQPRPRRVDRAHLVVDEAEWQRDLAHDVLRHVGCDAGARFGQAIQSERSGKTACPSALPLASNARRSVTKSTTTWAASWRHIRGSRRTAAVRSARVRSPGRRRRRR